MTKSMFQLFEDLPIQDWGKNVLQLADIIKPRKRSSKKRNLFSDCSKYIM